MRAAHQRPQLLDADLSRRHRGGALLGEDVERVLGHGEAVELSGVDRTHRGGSLDEVVARQREEDAARHGAARVAGAANALEKRRNGV